MTLEIDRLVVVRDGVEVVRGVSLAVAPGGVAAVLGANGAGKSELLLGVAGVLPLRGGSVRVDGRDVAGASPERVRAAGVAVVPEGHRVLAPLTVDENLRVAGAALGRRELLQTLDEVYAVFPELAERRRQAAGTMSGGQQQMVAIAHALMSRARYVLIDEMSLGLAPLIVRRLMDVVRRLAAAGIGVVLVEQFTEVALALADTVVLMRLGEATYSGPVQALRDDPSLLQSAYF